MPQTSSRFPLFVSVILGCLLLAGSSAPPSRSALPPTNNALPVLSGTAQVGRTLQVSTGTWSPTPASYEYAWHRCNLTVTTCQLSPTTASSPSYLLTAGDVGFRIVPQVAPDGLWHASANSPASAAVVGASSTPLNSVRPVLSGSAQAGQSLQVTTGTWSPAPSSYVYAWHRCSSSGINCQLSPTTSSSATYLLTSGDVGFTLVAQVAPDGLWSSSASSAASALVIGSAPSGPPVNSVRPALSGTAQVGQTLQVSNGTWSPTPSSYAYAWHRCSSSGCQLSPTSSSNASYMLTSGDVGFTLVAQVAPNGLWGSSANSGLSAVVVAATAAAPVSGTPVNSVRPSLSGSAQVGQWLSVSTGSWSPTPSSYAYAWHRCSSSGSCSLSPSSSSSSSYLVGSGDVGYAIVAQVAPNGLWGSSVSSAPSALVAGTAVASTSTGVIEGIGLLRFGNSYGSGSNYNRYAYVLVGRMDAAAAAKLPGKALVYMSGVDVNASYNTGVDYQTASANGWLLRDANGTVMTGYGHYLGDVGSTAYQQEWIRQVSSFLSQSGAEGVYIDDVLGNISTWSNCKCFPAKYSNLGAWQSAMVSFIRAVGPALKSRGFYVLASSHTYVEGAAGNQDGSLEAEWWRQLAPSVSGLMNEYWAQNAGDERSRSIGPNWDMQWDGWQRLVSVAQDAGADFFGITYGSSAVPARIRFAKGSFLLDWHGRGGGVIYERTDGGDPWDASYTADIGDPVSAKTQIATGVWQRQYSAGIVVVNATLSSVTVTVAGSTRTIAATDALILPA
jgi:hypothetical protein